MDIEEIPTVEVERMDTEVSFKYNILQDEEYIISGENATQWFPLGTIVTCQQTVNTDNNTSVNMRGLRRSGSLRNFHITISDMIPNTEENRALIAIKVDILAEERRLANIDILECIKVRKKITDQKVIPQVKESLEAIYPGNWDIQESLDELGDEPSFTYTLIIRFPEVTITNGRRGVAYKIKDLFVKLEYDEDFVMQGRMAGRRGRLSITDYASNYRHSHLPSQHSGDHGWSPFCLGASEISAMQTEWSISRDVQGPFDIIQFELYMYQIDAYVRWESLGGGPHYRISSIRVPGETRHIRPNRLTEYYNDVVSRIKDFPVKFDNTRKRFVIDFIDFEKFLTEKATVLGLELCKKAGDSYVYSNSTSLDALRGRILEARSQLADSQSTTLHYFKGVPQKQIIDNLDITEDMEKNLEDVVHPDITNHILHKLESFINYHFIKNYGK